MAKQGSKLEVLSLAYWMWEVANDIVQYLMHSTMAH